MKKVISFILAALMILAAVVGTLTAGAAEQMADLDTLKADDPAITSDSSYTARTSDSGWKATNARKDLLTFGDYGTDVYAVSLNGKTTALGTLTSPVLAGGVKVLAFNYGFMWSDTQFSATVTVKKASDGSVIVTDTLDKSDLTKLTVYSYTLEVNTTEDAIVEIANTGKSGASNNKDRVGLWNITWGEAPVVEGGNEGEGEGEGEAPALTTPEAIVNAAYALEKGASLEGTYTLTGVITAVDAAYSEQYKNVSVVIQIGDMADKPILCFRAKGDAASTVKVGDTITVTGTLVNYGGTIEFNSGCTIDAVVPGTSDEPVYTTPEEIVNAAYALEKDKSLNQPYTLTGVITAIDSAYSEQYKNVSVVIQVGDMADKPILCFRAKGDAASTVKVGDTITVTGTLMNYGGTIEFKSGCTIDSVVVAAPETSAPETSAPETSAPETTVPETSAPEETTAPTKPETGDSSAIVVIVAVSAMAILGTAVAVRKREEN